MALPETNVSPPQDQLRRLNEFLAELSPLVPPGIGLEPSWEPDSQGWMVWVANSGSTRTTIYGRFVRVGHELAERHGVEMNLVPVEARSWE